MALANPRHPKLTWKAFLRDLVFTVGACLALFLWAPVLGFGALWLTGYMHVNFGPSKQETARLDLENLQGALRRYHSEQGRFPSTGEGMRELVERQVLERVPVDPWGVPYGYELHEGHPRVWSLGGDGAAGGEGEEADLFLEQQ